MWGSTSVHWIIILHVYILLTLDGLKYSSIKNLLYHHSTVFRRCVRNTLFPNLLNHWFCSTNLWDWARGGGVGGTTKSQKFHQNTEVFVFVRAFHATKSKIVWKMWQHSIHSSLTGRKFCTNTIFLWSLALPKRSLDTWPLIPLYVQMTWICKWAF